MLPVETDMTRTATFLTLAVAAALTACSTAAPLLDRSNVQADVISTPPLETLTNETMLLVSLDDGTVIKQTINLTADVCFKMNSSSETTCLTQGEAIVDPDTNSIVGYEMIEDKIDLYAASE